MSTLTPRRSVWGAVEFLGELLPTSPRLAAPLGSSVEPNPGGGPFMAMFPCDRHGIRVSGPNHGVYVAIGAGAEMARYYLRFCDAHSLQLEERLDEFELDADGFAVRDGPASTICLGCSDPVGEDRWQVFVTHYVSKKDRKDYWAQLHPGCVVPDLLRPRTRRDAMVA